MCYVQILVTEDLKMNSVIKRLLFSHMNVLVTELVTVVRPWLSICQKSLWMMLRYVHDSAGYQVPPWRFKENMWMIAVLLVFYEKKMLSKSFLWCLPCHSISCCWCCLKYLAAVFTIGQMGKYPTPAVSLVPQLFYPCDHMFLLFCSPPLLLTSRYVICTICSVKPSILLYFILFLIVLAAKYVNCIDLEPND